MQLRFYKHTLKCYVVLDYDLVLSRENLVFIAPVRSIGETSTRVRAPVANVVLAVSHIVVRQRVLSLPRRNTERAPSASSVPRCILEQVIDASE